MLERLLIVGLGSIGTRHARLARELMPDVQIAALRYSGCSDLPDGIGLFYVRLEEALAFRPQAAVISSPSSAHLCTALPLAHAGVHLLIEKPISSDCEGVPALIDACRESGSVLMTGYNLRFLPSLQMFRDLVAGGRVGRVLSVRAEVGQYLPSWRPETEYRASVSASAALGGGVLLELSHEIDYLLWLFGAPLWVRAVQLRQSDLDIDVEDVVHLTIGFADDAHGHSVVATLNMDFVRHDTTRCCTVIGETGSLRWNGLTGMVEQYEMGAKEWRVLFHHQHQRDESYLAEWQHFLGCIEGRETPLITGEDGLRVLQIIEAIRQASDNGNQVRITMK